MVLLEVLQVLEDVFVLENSVELLDHFAVGH